MLLKIALVADSVIRKAGLPDRKARLQSKREPSFDELDRSLQRYFICGRDQRVQVIGHDYELVQEEFALFAIVEEDVYQQVSGGWVLE